MKLSNSRDRLVLHLFVGLTAVLMFWLQPILGLAFTASFLFYEWNEDERIHDYAYLDVVGFSWGLFAGAVVWAAVKIGLLTHFLGN